MRNQVPRRCGAMLVTIMLSLMLTVSARAANTPTSLWWFQVAANDGNTVYSTPIFDESGNIYGTAMEGGTHGFGIVFKLSPTLSGPWEETVLYDFKGGAADGASPHSTLLRDSAGNLYGTTLSGGLNSSLCS